MSRWRRSRSTFERRRPLEAQRATRPWAVGAQHDAVRPVRDRARPGLRDRDRRGRLHPRGRTQWPDHRARDRPRAGGGSAGRDLARSPRRQPLGRSAAVALAVALLMAWAPAAASAAWGRPFQLVKPGTLDYLPPQLAISPSGAASAGLGIGDVDTAGSTQAYFVSRSAGGKVAALHRIGGASQVLALAYAGSVLELIVGGIPGTLGCFSSAQALRVSAGGALRQRQTLVSGLTGATLGQVVPLADGRMLAAGGGERGVWATQSSKRGRFAAA